MRKLYIILFAVLLAVASCSKENPTPSPKIPEMVDLGLSVKWASFNVGATKPEEYGTYFAWGDVTGQIWDGSKWSGGGFSECPKFEVNANNNLKLAYDAAHVILGGDWRMPTGDEWRELKNGCTITSTSDYDGTGVAGLIFTGKKTGYTNKSIFIPSAGYGYETKLKGDNDGDYWSSTYIEGDEAIMFFFYESTISTFRTACDQGFPVRAVIE